MKKFSLKALAIAGFLLISNMVVSAQSIESLAGSPAPLWSLKTPDGKTINLADLKGKIVVIDFWATWCGPCKAAMPSIQKISKQFANKNVVVYGINAWEQDPQDAISYMKTNKYDYGLLLNGDKVAAQYHVEGIPSMVIINEKGIVAEVHVGFSENLYKTLEKSLTKLIAAK